MSNALIYSPGFDGHRQVYVFIFARILQELNFKVHIAGNTKEIITNSFYIDNLKNNLDISFIDTEKYGNGGYNISPSDFINLQNDCDPDITVFAEADYHISLFNSQIIGNRKKFRGRLIGIFLRPFYFYQTGLINYLRYFKHLPSLWREDDRLFHEFFLPRYSLLHAALFIDENYVAAHKQSYWIPDVFQQYADLFNGEDKSEQRVWIEKLDEFKVKNKGNFFVFYFGTAQRRRGYDMLLKIAVERSACFIHCGLRNDNERFDFNVDELRESLEKNGHLFETNQFIEDSLCVESFFKSASHLILPYRDFAGSSGVMLQALKHGIPILAPENGIIGYRINSYNLGLTYNSKKSLSLFSQFDKFTALNPEIFQDNIRNYMTFQTVAQLKKALINAFTGTDERIMQP